MRPSQEATYQSGADDNENERPYVVDLQDEDMQYHSQRSVSMSNQSVGSRSAYSVQLPLGNGAEGNRHPRHQETTPLSSYSISSPLGNKSAPATIATTTSASRPSYHQLPTTTTTTTTTSEPIVILDVSAITSDEDDGLVSVADLGGAARPTYNKSDVGGGGDNVDSRHHMAISAMASMRLPITAITPTSPPPRTIRSLGGMGGGIGDVEGSPNNNLSSMSRNLIPVAQKQTSNGLVVTSLPNTTTIATNGRRNSTTPTTGYTLTATASVYTNNNDNDVIMGVEGCGDGAVLPYMYLPPSTAWDASSGSHVQRVAYPPPFSSPHKSGIYDSTNKSGTALERFIQYQQEEICRPLNLSHPTVSKGLVKCTSLEVRAYDGGGGGGGARVLTWVSDSNSSTTSSSGTKRFGTVGVVGRSPISSNTPTTTKSPSPITAMSTVVDGGDASDVRVMAVAPRTLWGSSSSTSQHQRSTGGANQSTTGLSVYSPTKGIISQGRYYVPIHRISLRQLISLNPQLFSATVDAGGDGDADADDRSDYQQDQSRQKGLGQIGGVRGVPCEGCYLLRLPISIRDTTKLGGGNIKLPQPFQSLLIQGGNDVGGADGEEEDSVYITFVFPTFSSARMCFGAIEREIRYYC